MKKKILLVTLITVFLILSAVSVAASEKITYDYDDVIKIETYLSSPYISENLKYQYSTISRAEIAALLLRVLSQVDPNADGGFEDVKQTDWFYGTAGSAKKYGMIKGFEDNTFRGNNVIEKDQILTIASRVLQREMRYKTPENVDEWLKFTDADKIADWAKNDIALAAMANIITRTADNTIHADEDMTRGDVALIIMRLFYKIW